MRLSSLEASLQQLVSNAKNWRSLEQLQLERIGRQATVPVAGGYTVLVWRYN